MECHPLAKKLCDSLHKKKDLKVYLSFHIIYSILIRTVLLGRLKNVEAKLFGQLHSFHLFPYLPSVSLLFCLSFCFFCFFQFVFV